jgi:hypothetical protein
VAATARAQTIADRKAVRAQREAAISHRLAVSQHSGTSSHSAVTTHSFAPMSGRDAAIAELRSIGSTSSSIVIVGGAVPGRTERLDVVKITTTDIILKNPGNSGEAGAEDTQSAAWANLDPSNVQVFGAAEAASLPVGPLQF